MLAAALKANLAWFRASDAMLPADGSWGVAERVLLTQNNATAEKTKNSFPAWTDYGTHTIIEQRRPDCNFETAFLHLLAGELLPSPKASAIGENILKFLYFRSGCLARVEVPGMTPGTWRWSHITWYPGLWFDDDSWDCFVPLAIARLRPDLDPVFALTEWALKLAKVLAQAFAVYFPVPPAPGAKLPWDLGWSGDVRQPHWGALAVMALARAAEIQPQAAFRMQIDAYHRYLLQNQDSFNTSEWSYAVLGAAQSYHAYHDDLSLAAAKCFADKLTAAMSPEGNLPSQHGEAPLGDHLADTIYTLNWALLALQDMKRLDDKYIPAFNKLLALILKIQDKSPAPYLKGCWRGMYDLKAHAWGGGDCFEGGANSIYTGWTNAPIAAAIALEMKNSCLAEC